jgi:hypothetical protein
MVHGDDLTDLREEIVRKVSQIEEEAYRRSRGEQRLPAAAGRVHRQAAAAGLVEVEG